MMKRSNHCSIDHLIVCVWKLKQSTLMSVCAWWWCIIILSIYNHSHNTHSILFIDRFFIFFSFHPKKRIFCLRKENRCCIKTDRFKSIGIKFKWWIRWIWMCVCVYVCVSFIVVGLNDQIESMRLMTIMMSISMLMLVIIMIIVAYWIDQMVWKSDARISFLFPIDGWNPIPNWSISHKYSSHHNVSIAERERERIFSFSKQTQCYLNCIYHFWNVSSPKMTKNSISHTE